MESSKVEEYLQGMAKAVTLTDSDFSAWLEACWQEDQQDDTPNNREYWVGVCNEIRTKKRYAYADPQWQNQWLAVHEFQKYISKPKKTEQLYALAEPVIKAWILAFWTCRAVPRFGSLLDNDHLALNLVPVLLQQLPESTRFRKEELDLESLEAATLVDLFNQIGTHALEASGLKPTPELLAPIHAEYRRLLEAPCKAGTSAMDKAKELGLTEAEMAKAIQFGDDLYINPDGLCDAFEQQFKRRSDVPRGRGLGLRVRDSSPKRVIKVD